MAAAFEDSSTLSAATECNAIQNLSEQMGNIKLQPTSVLKPSWSLTSDSDKKHGSTDQPSVPGSAPPAIRLNNEGLDAGMEIECKTPSPTGKTPRYPKAMPLWFKRVLDSESVHSGAPLVEESKKRLPISGKKERKIKRRDHSAPYSKAQEDRDAQKAALRQRSDTRRKASWMQDVDELERSIDFNPRAPHWKGNPRGSGSTTRRLSEATDF